MIRLNKLLAERLSISRRKADSLIADGKVSVNGQTAANGCLINIDQDTVLVNDKALPAKKPDLTILFNKPTGFVCSRNSQGNNTIYDILPKKYQHLNPIGRLDKNSGGLLVLTSNGELNYYLSHPSNEKKKVYIVHLNKPLTSADESSLQNGVQLSDGISILKLSKLDKNGNRWLVTLYEGRNRQIRRSFEACRYKVTKLIRISFGDFSIDQVPKPNDILELKQ